MNKKLNRVLTILVSFSVLFSQNAFAGRIGGGRSIGMQRSISKPMNNNYTRQANPQQAQAQAQVQQTQRQGMSPGTAALVGAAAGAAGGYMLGKSMANDNSANNPNNAVQNEQTNNQATNQDTAAQQNKSENNIPWGIIAILAALLVIGLTIFRRKTSPQLAQPNNLGGNNNFKMPGLNQNNSFQKTNQQTGKFNTNNVMQMANISDNLMPDGIEIQYFLRQAKGMFLHIQSMNNPENVVEIEKYMTPELYQSIKADVLNNNFVADFSQLDCQLIECDNTNKPQIIASVAFSGLVSEEPTKPAIPFNETWNFIKYTTDSKWIVAGIQQTNSIN